MFHWGLPFTISYVAWIAMEIWISLRDRRKRAAVPGLARARGF